MNIKDIKNPEFLKDMNNRQLEQLAKEIRSFLIESVSQTGGHLSSNLGVVELSIALHKVFNAPDDKIFFDVGHQSYTHKILTGRAKDFDTLRSYQGLSGFQKRSESEYDCFEAGHSSTTISAALGMAIARDLNKEDYHILPVIGDGALTGGIAFEALNHLGYLKKKVIIILNDNEMSISKNVGGMHNFMDRLRISMPYNKAKQNYKELMKTNKVSANFYKISKKIKEKIKNQVVSNIFTDIGLDYIGPLDGHDFKDLLRGLEKAKNTSRPIVVHVLTKKGKGYEHAEGDNSGKWHGVGKFDAESGELVKKVSADKISFSQLMADALYHNMEKNNDIVAITPAMISGSKLEKVFQDFPQRSYDVGIAEQHAAMMASGLALSGKHPFLSVYSTFSQRCYDQFNHDLARMNLPCVIGLDRSGLVGEDGETHHGVFDIALYRNLPNFIISAPKDAKEAYSLVNTAFETKAPFIIRYPRDEVVKQPFNDDKVEIGCWKELVKHDHKVIITYGVHSQIFAELLEDNPKAGLIHALFIKPLNVELLCEVFNKYEEIIIYEPDVKAGGFSSMILEFANDNNFDTKKITRIGINDEYVVGGEMSTLLKEYQLDYQTIINNL